ncbi:MAG: amino acid synthesis family protein, partial [Gammaproteobacteria bacterium]|nr:amino acid synthesis family protein [Gammaproteobacteria bacterium]
MKATRRKYQAGVEETQRETGIDIDPPTRKATAMAVIATPFAGEYQQDLPLLMDIGAEPGDELGRRAVPALGLDPPDAQSYGKAAI